MANWKKITTDTDITALSSSLTTTDQIISASVAALSGSASDARNVLIVESSSYAHTASYSLYSPYSLTSTTLLVNVKNTSGGSIAKGVPVYATGVTGDNINISIASNLSSNTMPAIGVLGEALGINASGTAVVSGKIIGVDTSGFTAGQNIYVNSNGDFTQTKPTGSGFIQNIGVVGKVNSTEGEILIQGSGRSNDLPNLESGYAWVGNEDGVPTAILTSSFSSGSFSGSFQGDGSGLTGVPVDFPYSGSAEITGSFVVSGSFGMTGSFVATGSIISTGSIQSTGSVEFSFANRLGAWSTAPGLNVDRSRLGGTGNDVNAALAFGGESYCTCTEEYNGLTWSPSAALQNGGYDIAGAGTQTAALAVGGRGYRFSGACTEEYNGATWSPGGALSDVTYGRSAAGTQNAGLATGGYNGGICTEEYNGASWASGGALQIGVFNSVSVGTQNAALAFGGYSYVQNDDTNTTQQYNGSTWSIASSLNHTTSCHAGAGTETSALSFGGYTEEYDGTSWSVGGNLSDIRYNAGGAGGSKSSALAFGGSPLTSTSEEYAPGNTITKTFDYDESTGLTDITDLKAHNLTFSGTLTTSGSDAEIILDDSSPTPINAWRTSGNTIVERRNGVSGTYSGDVLSIGGESFQNIVDFSTVSRMVERFDHLFEVWSGANYTNIIRSNSSADYSLIAGGCSDTYNICSEILDSNNPDFGFFGPIWTTTAAPTTGRENLAQGSSVIFGGYDGTAIVNCTEEYDSNTGTWSTCTGMSLGRVDLSGNGQSSVLATGGDDGGSITNCTEMYNGGVWTTCAGMGTSRKYHASSGVGQYSSNCNTLAFGGYLSYGACSEQFDPTSNTWANRDGSLVGNYSYTNGNAFTPNGGEKSPMSFSSSDDYNRSFIYNWKSVYNPDYALNYNSSDLTARGCFEGEFKGCFNGQACSALESGFASIANTATTAATASIATTAATASYVESDDIDFSTLNNYANDTAAAAGGVPIGSLYRNGNFIVIRLT